MSDAPAPTIAARLGAVALAEPRPYDPLWVGVFLDAAGADALSDAADPATLDGFPLHVTLWYGTGPADERQWARVLAALDECASYLESLSGQVAGTGTFDNADQQVVIAIPSVPGLDELRATIVERLSWQGLPAGDPHGWVPHVTLGYRDPGSTEPLPVVPITVLTFDRLSVAWGDRTVDLPFANEMATAVYTEPAKLSAGDGLRAWQPLRLATGKRPDAEWVPCLPVPGTYSHPWYGDLTFTAESHARAVQHVKDKTYQDSIPVNAEHDLATSGAVGWIDDARVNSAGAVDVFVRWTTRGMDLLSGDRFRFVSAEYMYEWTDPVDDARYTDIICGLAICTRPYFKPSVLKPIPTAGEKLAASEPTLSRVLSQPANPAGGDSMADEPSTTTAPPAESAPAADDQTVKALTDQILVQLGKDAKITDPVVKEFVEKVARERIELESKARDEAQRAQTLAEQNAILRVENRVKAFTDEVMGRSSSNNVAYVGHIPDMVRMCCSLADKFGESSWELEHYKLVNRAHAEQIAAGSLFKEIGIGRGAENTATAEDQANALAREIVARTPGKTQAQAFVEVLNSNPSLKAQLARERRGGR